MSNKSLVGTQTEKNLVAAYLSETSAYAQYIFYAKQANKEGYFPVEVIFNATAENELHHAKIYYKMLPGGLVGQPFDFKPGSIGDTASNLATAVAEEENEGVEKYTAFAKVADEEGFPEIAEHFRAIASIEMKHKERFARYLKHVVAGTLWKRDEPVTWRCLVCGYEYVGTEPPKVCPACDHPYQHYVAIGDFDV